MMKEDSGGGEEEKQKSHETTIEMPWRRTGRGKSGETGRQGIQRKEVGGGRGWFKAIRFPLNLTGRTWTEGWMTIGSLSPLSIYSLCFLSFLFFSGSEPLSQMTKIFSQKEEGKKGWIQRRKERQQMKSVCLSLFLHTLFFSKAMKTGIEATQDFVLSLFMLFFLSSWLRVKN